ncbi:MAG: voltage-gated potassium channel [Actinomycetota bacterium]
MRAARLSGVVREELQRLVSWSERHRRLLARLLIVFLLTLVADAVGSVLAWRFEEGVKGSDIHNFGDAAFFATVQLLTVSSSLMNPVTAAGNVLDVVLEAWAVLVVTAVAGSFATFFQAGDSS